MMQQKKTVGSASASLVLGILGIFLLIPAIPAIICGHVARSKIRKQPDLLSGKGMALAGLIMGYVAISFFVIMAVLAMITIQKESNRIDQAKIASTRASIGAISTAVNIYEAETGRLPNSLNDLARATHQRPALLRNESLNDAWGKPFQFRSLGRDDFEIRSAGPDQILGTNVDITN